MSAEDITLGVFAICNVLRIFAYLPQIVTAATDRNGATAISCTTWWLFLLAHLSTVAFALVNQSDWRLAVCFVANAACCLAILVVTYRTRRQATFLGAKARRSSTDVARVPGSQHAADCSEQIRQAKPC